MPLGSGGRGEGGAADRKSASPPTPCGLSALDGTVAIACPVLWLRPTRAEIKDRTDLKTQRTVQPYVAMQAV